MKGFRIHMLDVANVGDEFSVAEYARRAKPIVEDIFARGKLRLFVAHWTIY